jgi:hypothetical protein
MPHRKSGDVQPYRSTEAKRRITAILDSEDGRVVFAEPHMSERMTERSLEKADVLNVLERGRVREAEWENGQWRHHVWTAKITVVVAFPEDKELTLLVVTCWRNAK